MSSQHRFDFRRIWGPTCLAAAVAVAGCGGGGTGSERDSGPEKTTLSVAASDADGDALSYQWRVTAGSIENRNAAQTIWTLPQGPGLHFAYVVVSDGRGGYAEQQYAVSSDALNNEVPGRVPVAYPLAASAPVIDGTAIRIRLRQGGQLRFGDPDSGPERQVYMPDVTVRVRGAGVVFTGITDLSGELNLPQLAPGTYEADCAAPSGSLVPCSTPTFTVEADEVLAGAVPAGPLLLHRVGGELDGLVLGYEDMPQLETGMRAVVFLRERAPGQYVVTALRQGVLRETATGFDRDLRGVAGAPARDESWTLEALRATVRSVASP